MKQPTALWHNKRESWLKGEKPSFLNGKIVVESLYSMVSAGTERMVITQDISQATASKMRVPYMQGEFDSDFTYGYSLVGKVIQGSDHIIGKTVHVMHPHQDLIEVDERDITLLQDNLDPRLATLASNMETAVNAIWDAQVELGDDILIIGYGTVGGLIAEICHKTPGVTVHILEVDPYRKKVAEEQGLYTNVPNDMQFDRVFNTSTNEKMLQKALEHTKHDSKIIELSWYGNQTVNLKLGDHFHYGRKSIVCSQVSQIPYRKQPLWDYQSRKKLAFKLLKELMPEHLIDKQVLYSESPEFFDRLRNEKANFLGAVIKY